MTRPSAIYDEYEFFKINPYILQTFPCDNLHDLESSYYHEKIQTT
jgi:hypothetical protein